MGSSKKHKSEKRRKRSRSPDRDRERHRSHKKHKRHRHEETVQTIISSDSSDIEEISVILPPPPPKISSGPPSPPLLSAEPSGSGGAKSKESLSIEETNALRAKLGLKPLQIDGAKRSADPPASHSKRVAEDGTDMGEFIHKPATNLAQKKKSDKLRERLADRKEKRVIDEKLKSVRGLGESDSDDDTGTKGWVKKSREKELQRKEADKRAKMLEELDHEFGISAMVEEERRSERKELYSSRDLRGLRVGHAVDRFDEGANVILTLKDHGVLDEDPDTLVNVNMIDNERYQKNVERKKKKPAMGDDDDMEVEPWNQRTNVLSKYDEEIEGEKEDSFALGEEMSEAAKIRRKLSVRNKLNVRASFDLSTDLKLASDYYTEEEANAKFKKPGRVKKLRKKAKPLTADDLIPKQEVEWPTEDLGCRRRPVMRSRSSEHYQTVDMDIVKDDPVEPDLNVNDLPAIPDDLYSIKIEPDEAELELQLALNKARKLKQREAKNPLEKIAKEIGESGSVDPDGPGGTIILNSTAEFCRTLGDIPTYGLSGNREEEEEFLEFEREMKEESLRFEEERLNRGAWSQVDNDEKVEETVADDVPILDEEPDVGKGIAGALRLAISKGYLEKETTTGRPSARFAHLQAQNYSIEDKTHADDEKFGRRDRFAGPTTDFKEKDNYKPNVKLDYIDDDGHLLCAKEAFRYLSHKFHGKGPGKNKVEKRMKKNEQEGLMKQMSSTDTPLRTLTMLQQKQKETQSAFVVLSGKGQVGSTSSISKTK